MATDWHIDLIKNSRKWVVRFPFSGRAADPCDSYLNINDKINMGCGCDDCALNDNDEGARLLASYEEAELHMATLMLQGGPKT